ncbi:hypothetical protein ACHAWO_009198 [Cyclotella atomus]|uniref:Uncharacterized protein n=1 Tax=Cyclotella atomus TaxID=382360 RepID=A0ABD3QU27_9STRA
MNCSSMTPLGLTALLLLLLTAQSTAFAPPRTTSSSPATLLSAHSDQAMPRRTILARTIAIALVPTASHADDFESIAARAAAVSAQITQEEENANRLEEERKMSLAKALKDDTRSIYDFELPVSGKSRGVKELVGDNVKAVLVVNIKQDDPLARKNIPELIALADRFGRDFAVILSPTDQGYYEPDTSALIRLKLASEYGYGNSPSTILTDKVNLLGSGAVPFWRWLEGSCRTPAGLGKIQANFEKFLVDGSTGKPLRRYPRKYQPYDIADDIAALIQGRQLPPAQANFKEEWRNAAKEAENDTYRFQKGLNYFDQ